MLPGLFLQFRRIPGAWGRFVANFTQEAFCGFPLRSVGGYILLVHRGRAPPVTINPVYPKDWNNQLDI
jgi:hypothetical protein